VQTRFVTIFNEDHPHLKTCFKPAFQTYYGINDARGSALIISAEAKWSEAIICQIGNVPSSQLDRLDFMLLNLLFIIL